MNVEKIYKSGRPGELAAVSYLVHQGWSIREVNWRFRRAEIDIIAEFRQTIIFVEVKSRTCPKSPPELAVSAQQESRLADAAREYLWINQWTGPFVLMSLRFPYTHSRKPKSHILKTHFFLATTERGSLTDTEYTMV
ncbi:MAG: YraN family protein [Saprospiraceae bacterium]|nr:YraN family protein [Saprospiraceae bacterium]